MPVGNSGLRSLAMLGLFLVVTFAASMSGVFVGPGDWYASLKRPTLTPPNWVFGPVWTTLYVCMAVAAWRVWKNGWGAPRRDALECYFGQLLLNAAWTPLFFGLHRLGAALGLILALWVAISLTIWRFSLVDRWAAWLLAPYLAWVTLATYLNLMFWYLN
jgi:tryptophan-rich sensory protein